MDINGVFQTAFRHFQRGQSAEAERLCGQILKRRPKNIDARHLLGLIFYSREDYDRAIEHIGKVVALNPRDADANFNLGNAYAGKKQFDEAIEYYKNAIRQDPNIVEAHDNLGNAYIEKIQMDEAIASFKKAIAVNPGYAPAYNNLGCALREKGERNEAIASFQKALSLNPQYADAHFNLGVAYDENGRLNDAIRCLQRALRLKPDISDAHFRLGTLFHRTGSLHDAAAQYQMVIRMNPDFSAAHVNLGTVLRENGQLDDAEACHRKALRLDPFFPKAYYHFGNTLFEQGRYDKAFAAYDAALFCDPDFIGARWARCMAHLRHIYPDEESVARSRASYGKALTELQDAVSRSLSKSAGAVADAVGSLQPFYLPYQGMPDRELQRRYGSLVCQIMQRRYPEFAERPAMPALRAGEPLRVGIVSGFFCRHSNWKIPIRGWVENMDRELFQLTGYYTRRVKDADTGNARKSLFRLVEDVQSFEELCRIIRADNLHVLIYPETGMDPLTVRLASLRLAPVQCASWGHPVTSGLPSLDFYLSSDLMEPPGADEHYTERLVRLPNLSIHYTPLEVPYEDIHRDAFGIRPSSVVYLCCQNLSKYLPGCDDVFPRIAEQLDDCRFVFISNIKSPWITEQFRARIRRAFERFNRNADDHIVFVPYLNVEKYHGLNRMADVFLDSIGWSGCNSTFEALAHNLPVVTLPGELMRGRHSPAILTMMGLTETIAKDLNEYVSLAVRLGRNPIWRREISEKISANKHRVYGDMTCVRALEAFLEGEVKKRCTPPSV